MAPPTGHGLATTARHSPVTRKRITGRAGSRGRWGAPRPYLPPLRSPVVPTSRRLEVGPERASLVPLRRPPGQPRAAANRLTKRGRQLSDGRLRSFPRRGSHPAQPCLPAARGLGCARRRPEGPGSGGRRSRHGEGQPSSRTTGRPERCQPWATVASEIRRAEDALDRHLQGSSAGPCPNVRAHLPQGPEREAAGLKARQPERTGAVEDRRRAGGLGRPAKHASHRGQRSGEGATPGPGGAGDHRPLLRPPSRGTWSDRSQPVQRRDWWARWDSNPGPADYESAALTVLSYGPGLIDRW